MGSNNQKPIIFLAFANEPSDEPGHLRNLGEEARRLENILEQAEQKGLCELVSKPYASLDTILDVLQEERYRNQIAIFHYAGHANGYQLLLESESGTAAADAGGLAAFLGQQTGLQLVFLNGCSTQLQVQGLLAAGVPAVIATSHGIKDDVATEFASRFYQGLVGGAVLRTAYNEAAAALHAALGSSNTRQLYWADSQMDEAITAKWPWELCLQEGDETRDQWDLSTFFITQQTRSRLSFEPETVLIPAGRFTMGSQPGNRVPEYETPQFEVVLGAYQIGKYPVTNAEYAQFVKHTQCPAPQKAGWFGRRPPQDKPDHPVVRVNWYDALAYCRWLSEQTGRTYRLPTEAEWEKAARGVDGRIYPWGDEWDAGRCNCAGRQTTPVSAFPSGQSPYGCYDMIGNVWEWSSTLWGSDWRTPEFNYPYQAQDGREDLAADTSVFRLFRGGSFEDKMARLRCAARRWYAPEHAGKVLGFRVLLEI